VKSLRMQLVLPCSGPIKAGARLDLMDGVLASIWKMPNEGPGSKKMPATLRERATRLCIRWQKSRLPMSLRRV
jgi:hypothetical protein